MESWPASYLVAILVATLLLAGCGDSGVHDSTRAAVPTGTGAAATTPIDRRAIPALDAWASFLTAIAAAESRPFSKNETPSAAADFTRYAWDPARYQFQDYIEGLKRQGIAYRGAPEQSHPKVTSLDLAADPAPTVSLSDCLTGSGWIGYDVKTGKPIPEPSASVAPPYPASVTMVLYRQRWGVEKVSFDESVTCTA